MLPAANRLTDSGTFRLAVRSGRRAGGRLLVAHLVVDVDAPEQAPVVGFTVSRAVGNAVVRNRVKRRIRDAYHHVLPELPRGFTAIFVARKSAADADFAQIERAVRAVLTKAGLLPSVV